MGRRRRSMGMMDAFPLSFLWLVSFIYFTQIFVFFPWSIKPIYGILSDCIPIRGKKRTPYLVISTILSLFPWILLGSITAIRSSQTNLMVFLTIQNIGSAMADVVIDAMIAEAVRSEQAAFAGDLQTLSWSAMALGGICGSLLGGHSLANISISTVFLLFSVLPAIQLLSCILVEELPSSSKTKIEESTGVVYSGPDFDISVKQVDNLNIHNGLKHKRTTSSGNKLTMESSWDYSTVVERKKNENSQSKVVDPGIIYVEEHKKSTHTRSFVSLKLAFQSLCHAFRKPVILRPMAWFFVSNITIPNLSTVMFYYQTEVLKLEASFLGTTRVLGWLSLMLGSFLYNRYLKRLRLRRVLLWAHLGLASLNILDILLVSRKNIEFGLSDKHMVLGGSALSDAINQFKMMPFLILSGQLCPPGIEGTLFAFFMSINNLGSTVGSLHGAALASLLNITSDSFDNLLLGVSIQSVCNFIPICFLFLVPREATGLSS